MLRNREKYSSAPDLTYTYMEKKGGKTPADVIKQRIKTADLEL